MNQEVWKDIPNYQGKYQVSNLGNLKSLNYRRSGKENLLKLKKSNQGYFTIDLRNNKIKKTRLVHQMVAEAFLNHKPCGRILVVNHINFDKTDNRVENLEVVTIRYNSSHLKKKGTSKYIGVYWNKLAKKWRAQIVIDGKKKGLGAFENEHDAHLAYQNALNNIKK